MVAMDSATAEATAPINGMERAALDRLLSNYRLTPFTIAMKLNPLMIPAKHLLYISSRVAAAISKGNSRLIISLPPRHGKTETITINTPIWTFENFRNKNIILATYGAELSSDFGRKTRDLIADNEDALKLRVRRDATRANNWLTNNGGAMRSVGLGGSITGRGADVLVIDDYIKEIKEALSESQRQYIWDWFVTTAFTRLEPNGTCIVIATRWHEDDLIGRILKANPGGRWENIVIPALAEPEGYKDGDKVDPEWRDFLGRKFGEALFSERGMDEKFLLERKETLGTYFFNALYQQRPENSDSKLTDRLWLKYLTSPPVFESHIKLARIWDLAATEDGGDYCVGTLMAYDTQTNRTYILDIKRKQLSPKKIEQLIITTANLDGKNVNILLEQEPGSSGPLLTHHYANTLLPGFNVEGITTNKNKVVRAQPFLAAVEAGKVYLLTAGWNKTFADEYNDFPAGEHDDQVDTCAIGYNVLSGKKKLSASWGRAKSSEDDIESQGTQRFYSPEELELTAENVKLQGEVYASGLPRLKYTSGVTFGRDTTR